MALPPTRTQLVRRADIARERYRRSHPNTMGRKYRSKKACFIATTVYGSEFHENVVLLRIWRDSYLRKRFLGRLFVKLYYIVGPIAAKCISRSLNAKSIVRSILNTFIKIFVKC